MTFDNPIPLTLEGPQPLVRDTPPGPAYPVEFLGPLKAAVLAVACASGAPVAIAAQSALATASLAVQAHANVVGLSGGIVPLSLFCLTVAKSGERKSTCDAEFMKGIDEYERAQAEQYRHEVREWTRKQTAWKVQHNQIAGNSRRTKQVSPTEIEAAIERLGSEPAAPPLPDRTVTEPTFEGLTRLYVVGQPSLGIFSDEGGQFLGGHGMNSDNNMKTMAAFNNLWDGKPVKRTRAGDGAYTLRDRRLAIHLMAQPEVARTLITDRLANGSGFLPRFLITEPASNIGSRPMRSLVRNSGPIDVFRERLRKILERPMPMAEPETRELQPRTLRLSPEARDELTNYHDWVESRQGRNGDLSHVTGHASKSAEQAARIAGVLTMFADPDATYVSLEMMRCGTRLANYYLTEAARLADEATISDEIQRGLALQRWLLDKWKHDEITPREIQQYGPHSLRESPKVRAAIGTLERHGWLIRLPAGSVVRGAVPKEAWRVVRG